VTCTVALAPAARLPSEQLSVWVGDPVIEHVPGPLYAGLIDQLTPVPPGNGSPTDTPAAVAVPAALLLLTVTVKPIDEPVLTVAASAVLVIESAGGVGGTMKLAIACPQFALASVFAYSLTAQKLLLTGSILMPLISPARLPPLPKSE